MPQSFVFHLLHKNVKIKIHKIIILPVVFFECETQSLALREKHESRVRFRMFIATDMKTNVFWAVETLCCGRISPTFQWCLLLQTSLIADDIGKNTFETSTNVYRNERRNNPDLPISRVFWEHSAKRFNQCTTEENCTLMSSIICIL